VVAEPVVALASTPVVAEVAEVAAPVVVEPVAAPVAAIVAAPVVAVKPVFALPTAELDQLAQSSGLQWVGTSPERAAAVQAAIASEPIVVHVPRVRPAVAPVQAEPLVMVETKRDLGKMDLPF
jgi:ribonuclease E